MGVHAGAGGAEAPAWPVGQTRFPRNTQRPEEAPPQPRASCALRCAGAPLVATRGCSATRQIPERGPGSSRRPRLDTVASGGACQLAEDADSFSHLSVKLRVWKKNSNVYLEFCNQPFPNARAKGKQQGLGGPLPVSSGRCPQVDSVLPKVIPRRVCIYTVNNWDFCLLHKVIIY